MKKYLFIDGLLTKASYINKLPDLVLFLQKNDIQPIITTSNLVEIDSMVNSSDNLPKNTNSQRHYLDLEIIYFYYLQKIIRQSNYRDYLDKAIEIDHLSVSMENVSRLHKEHFSYDGQDIMRSIINLESIKNFCKEGDSELHIISSNQKLHNIIDSENYKNIELYNSIDEFIACINGLEECYDRVNSTVNMFLSFIQQSHSFGFNIIRDLKLDTIDKVGHIQCNCDNNSQCIHRESLAKNMILYNVDYSTHFDLSYKEAKDFIPFNIDIHTAYISAPHSGSCSILAALKTTIYGKVHKDSYLIDAIISGSGEFSDNLIEQSLEQFNRGESKYVN